MKWLDGPLCSYSSFDDFSLKLCIQFSMLWHGKLLTSALCLFCGALSISFRIICLGPIHVLACALCKDGAVFCFICAYIGHLISVHLWVDMASASGVLHSAAGNMADRCPAWSSSASIPPRSGIAGLYGIYVGFWVYVCDYHLVKSGWFLYIFIFNWIRAR